MVACQHTHSHPHIPPSLHVVVTPQFPQMPHYNLEAATEAAKVVMGPYYRCARGKQQRRNMPCCAAGRAGRAHDRDRRPRQQCTCCARPPPPRHATPSSLPAERVVVAPLLLCVPRPSSVVLHREPKKSPGPIPTHLVEPLVRSFNNDHYVADTGDVVFYQKDARV